MPIYEYKCSSCGHQQEYLQKVSDPQVTRCEACGQEALSKMVTAAGFQLKGSGWYATDFKGSGAKPKAASGDAAKTDGAKTDGAKTEGARTESAKGEAKAEAKKESAAPPSTTGGSPSGS
jgi:putative FmdB family regulatory protein